MPQLTKENGLLQIIDKDIHTFGQVGPTDVISFEFDYKGSESSIEYIETTCPCIKAWYQDGKIIGTMDMARILRTAYTPGETSVGKNVSVFLNDGVNRFTADKNKQKQQHPLKRWFSLLVTGTVVA